MSSCRLGSWARVCAMGQLFSGVFFLATSLNSSPIESQFDSGRKPCVSCFSTLLGEKNKLIPGIALARKIPTRGNHPSQTLRNVTTTTGRLSYPSAFPLSFDSYTNVLG